jgi:hypothetical protein
VYLPHFRARRRALPPAAPGRIAGAATLGANALSPALTSFTPLGSLTFKGYTCATPCQDRWPAQRAAGCGEDRQNEECVHADPLAGAAGDRSCVVAVAAMSEQHGGGRLPRRAAVFSGAAGLGMFASAFAANRWPEATFGFAVGARRWWAAVFAGFAGNSAKELVLRR